MATIHVCNKRAREEVRRMAWETPEFVEIKMDAEIGSYQDEFDGR